MNTAPVEDEAAEEAIEVAEEVVAGISTAVDVGDATGAAEGDSVNKTGVPSIVAVPIARAAPV